MKQDFSSITELPGNRITSGMLEMICLRYHTAARYAKKKRVLEVGCGPGLGLGYLSRRAGFVVAGDYTENNLLIAKRHYKNKVPLLCLNGEELPFRKGVFDLVLLFEVLFYFRDPAAFIKESSRVLTKGGQLILCLPNKDISGFIPSEFSVRYFSVPELAILLSREYKNVRLYGAFPLAREPVKTKLRLFRLSLAKIFNYFPGGKMLKEWLKRFLMKKNIVLGHEINGDLSKGIKMFPLSDKEKNNLFQIIYVIAEK
ncbi:MAG: class I SAM-dependent methyltransferase [bacterium]|nr:class I SAM-dependent methyltransferase [bacterium]